MPESTPIKNIQVETESELLIKSKTARDHENWRKYFWQNFSIQELNKRVTECLIRIRIGSKREAIQGKERPNEKQKS